MSYKSLILVLFVGTAGAGIAPPSVDAAQLSAPQQIIVTATVMPAVTVLIDDNGRVMKIIANSNRADIEPTVFQNRVTAENARSLTPKLKESVDSLLAGKTVMPGVVYDRLALNRQPVRADENTLMQLFGSKIFNLN